ncbi:MAG: hypothetical protein KDA91_20140, partial [Planctomycetaceae bacterium]|nr:hypothetical protein [Planctomycetaceae bacterium]
GGNVVFMNGAQGGMVTADNRDLGQLKDPVKAVWSDHRTWEECERIGQLMAEEALRIIQNAPTQKSPSISCRTARVKFPVDSALMWAIIAGSPLQYPHDPSDRSITTRISLARLGDARILTVPGEALPNIGFYLKRKMTSKNAMLFGLTNDAFGYILTDVDFESFDRYSYVSRTSLGERTGPILIREALKLIDADDKR